MEEPVVKLRALQEHDAETLYTCYAASDAHLFTTSFWHPWSIEDFRRFVSESKSHTDGFRLGICKCEDTPETLIGFIELNRLNWVHGTAEVGITIFPIEDRRRGFGAAALRAVAMWAFSTLRLRRLHAKMFAANHASRRCFEKVGFKHEGIWRKHFYINGESVDALLYGLLREEIVDGI